MILVDHRYPANITNASVFVTTYLRNYWTDLTKI